MVNPRARRTSIGSMLNAKFSRPQLKAEAATLPPRRPPTRDRLRRNPVKRQGSPDREKARPAPHSSMRASSRGTRDDDDAISGRGSPAPPFFVETNRGRFSGAATARQIEPGLQPQSPKNGSFSNVRRRLSAILLRNCPNLESRD